jgi:hypothetical protein
MIIDGRARRAFGTVIRCVERKQPFQMCYTYINVSIDHEHEYKQHINVGCSLLFRKRTRLCCETSELTLYACDLIKKPRDARLA